MERILGVKSEKEWLEMMPFDGILFIKSRSQANGMSADQRTMSLFLVLSTISVFVLNFEIHCVCRHRTREFPYFAAKFNAYKL